jgi:hypothetical protein
MCALCSVFNTVQRENAAPLGGIHQYTIQPLVVGNGIVGAQRLIVKLKYQALVRCRERRPDPFTLFWFQRRNQEKWLW